MIYVLVLLALIVPIVVVEPLRDFNVLPKLAATVIFTSIALIWGAMLIARDRWPAGRWPLALWAAVGVFVVVNVLACVFARDWRWSLLGEQFRYQGLGATLAYVLLFGAAAVAVRTTRDLRWLVLALFAGGLMTSVYALIQKSGFDWYEDMWAASVADRPAATLGQANVFGAYLVAVISASLYLPLTASKRWQQVAYGAGLIVMVFALYFTASRSAFLAAGVVILFAGVAFVVLTPSLRERLNTPAARSALISGAALPLLLALAGVFLIGLPQGRVSVSSDANSTAVDGRLSLWRLGAEMTFDRPLLGHGQDAYTILFAEYRDRADLPGIGTNSVEPESAHNFYIDLAAGTGLLGLAAFLALVGAVFWYALRRVLSTSDITLRYGLLALTGGAGGYLAAVFFGFSEAMSTWVLWLLLGALAGLGARVEPDGDEEEETVLSKIERQRSLAAGMAAVALTLVGVVGLGWATTLLMADEASARSVEATIDGDHARAAQLADRAAMLNPISKTYLFQYASTKRSLADAAQDPEAYEEAIDAFRTVLERFEPGSTERFALGAAMYALAELEGVDTNLARFEIEKAVEEDFYNRQFRFFVADYYESRGFAEEANIHRVVAFCFNRPCGDLP